MSKIALSSLCPWFGMMFISGVLYLPVGAAESGAGGGADKAGILINPALMEKSHVLYSPQSNLPVGTVSLEKMKIHHEGKLGLQMGDRVQERGTMDMIDTKKKRTTRVRADTFEILYEQDDINITMTRDEQKKRMPVKKGVLVGKTIVFTKLGDTWTGAFKDGQATEEQKKELAAEVKKFNNDDKEHIVGKTPRKVGDSWDVDVSKLSSFSEDGSPAEGKFKVTFKTIANHKGQTCAVLVADVDITANADNNGKFRLKGKFTMHQSLKYQVMLRNRAEVTMILGMGSIEAGRSVLITGPATMENDYEYRIP